MAKTSNAKTKTSQKRKVQTKAKAHGTRANSKQAQLIEMLQRPEGATIEDIVKKFDWQAHTVRGAIWRGLQPNAKTARLLALFEGQKPQRTLRVKRLVAGVGFEPTTFRL